MTACLSTELLKAKRSVILWVIIACLAVPFARVLLDMARWTGPDPLTWEGALELRLDYWVFGAFVVVVVAGSYAITRENEDGTIRSLFGTPHSAAEFLASKLAVTVLLLSAATLLSVALRVVSAALASGGPLTGHAMRVFARTTLLTWVQLGLLIPWVALVATLTRRMYASVLTCVGLVIILFPFHRSDHYYLFPHLIPVLHFSSLVGFDATDRIFSPQGWISLGVFSAVCLALDFALYRRR